jgi:Fe-S oxidoreductase
LLRDDPQYRDAARTWDAKLRDVHEWLVEIGSRAPGAAPFDRDIALTYHDSCHLVHGQKVSVQPRARLRQLPGVTVVELTESTWCCGGAGVYALTRPDQAEALLRRKVGHINATGAQLVATANPGCHMQIARGLGDAGVRIQVAHPISLLASVPAGTRQDEPVKRVVVGGPVRSKWSTRWKKSAFRAVEDATHVEHVDALIRAQYVAALPDYLPGKVVQ